MFEMYPNQRSISVGGYIDENEALVKIGDIAKGFDNVSGCWRGANIYLSIQTREREPFNISKNITKALVEMFRTIQNARERSLSFLSNQFHEAVDFHRDESTGTKRTKMESPDFAHIKQNDRLFLQLDPAICDDANFRAILGAAVKSMTLKELIMHGYGNFYPSGTVGNSSLAEICDNQQRGPSLWELIESNDSLEHLHVSVHGPNEDCKDASYLSGKEPRLPQLWEAIKGNKSLVSLSVHLYCHVREQEENEENIMMLHRFETMSTMKSLSESLKEHSSIQKLEVKYRRDAHQRTVLVPHVTNLLESSNLHEFRLDRFSFYVNVDQIEFPMNDFIQALSKAHANQSLGKDAETHRNCNGELEVLRLCNIGLTDIDANELLRYLPNCVKVLDLSKNALVDFPVTTCNRNSSQLRELNLWKNPCLYNHDQETSLRLVLSLLLKYPCLIDFGPWDKWQLQAQVPNSRPMPTNGDSGDEYTSLQNLVDRIDSIADQNRCKTRFVPKNTALAAKPSLWPLVLSKTKNFILNHGQQERRRLLKKSTKPLEERHATVTFSVLRENFSGSIFSHAQRS